jgi:hypothetical protein
MVQPVAVTHLFPPWAVKFTGGEDANASHPVAGRGKPGSRLTSNQWLVLQLRKNT